MMFSLQVITTMLIITDINLSQSNIWGIDNLHAQVGMFANLFHYDPKCFVEDALFGRLLVHSSTL